MIADPFRPPRLVVTFEFEARPRVHVECAGVGERAELEDWLNAHKDYAEVVQAALDLRQEEVAGR